MTIQHSRSLTIFPGLLWKSLRHAATLSTVVVLTTGVAIAEELDEVTGLIKDTGWTQVRNHCGACHSYSVVTSQRANRDGWLDVIRRMQKSHNFWQLPPETEATLLDYLAENYGPSESKRRRRAQLASELLPKQGS